MSQEDMIAPGDPGADRAQGQIELLTFSIGGQDYAVDIMLVREIRNWSKPTPLPKTPSYVRGVINLRGTVLPILDLAARLELTSEAADDRTVFVVINDGERLFGVAVDGVSDILTVGREALQEPPTLGETLGESCVSGLILEEDRMIRVLAADRLAPRDPGLTHEPSAA
ncbi:MAG: chemotaxis protein CheW [Pseudomonadota bacterium]